MNFYRKLSALFLVVVCTIALSSCSSSDSKEKTSTTTSNKDVTIVVKNRSTTNGTQTTDTLDKKIEKTITSHLTAALNEGTSNKDLFAAGVAEKAAQDFPDNSDAKKNSVDVSYSYMASNNPNEATVVADITQTVTDKNNETITRTGKIFFDTSGLILGFSFPDSTTTTTAPKAST